MLLIAGVTACLTFALVGFGAFFCRFLEPLLASDLRAKATFGELGLLGIAVIATAGATLNWLVALDAFVGIIAVGLGIIAAVVMRARILEALRYAVPTAISAALVLALLVHVSLVTYRMNFGHYDLGLYYLQTIVLAERSPLILGAANLHMRFGYNSLWLVFAEMFTLPVWGLRTAGLLNGVITIFGIEAIWQHLWRDFRPGTPLPVAIFSSAMLLLIFFGMVISYGDNLGSPSSDWPAALLTLYVFSLGFRAIASAREATDRKTFDLFLMFTMGALATAFKLSQAPIFLAVSVVATALYLENHGTIRAIFVGAAAASFIFLLWLLHGIGLSGCLLYPVSMTCIDWLPWTVAAHVADSDAAWIKSWARLPNVEPSIVLADWRWLPKWCENISRRPLMVLIGAVYGLNALSGLTRLIGHGAICLGIETIDIGKRHWVIGLQGAAIGGIAYWFLVAPDPRFGYGFLIAQPAMLLALMLPVKCMRLDQPKALQLPAAAATSGLLLAIALAETIRAGSTVLLSTDRPTVETAAVIEHRSASGFVYYSPIAGDRCWASPPFCTPYPNASLKWSRVGLWSVLTRK